MHLTGITVCVDYSHHLRQTIERWKESIDALMVVTSPDDAATHELCHDHGVQIFTTNRFREDGALFNKAGAMNQCLRAMAPIPDWLLMFDADILPPTWWRHTLDNIHRGRLYGARRVKPDGSPEPCHGIAGWFMLMHGKDPRIDGRPLDEYNNASGYDTDLVKRWDRVLHEWLPFNVTHLGQRRTDWCGVDSPQAMAELLHQREIRGNWKHERMDRGQAEHGKTGVSATH